ncbi:hypothetical protein GCM10027347_19010 [Larkinella harenae]
MIPIVFIHSGYHPYLEYSLRQARLANPESTVFLLGDDANKSRFPFVTHDPLSGLNPDKSALFAQLYVHRSTNPYWYELLCFLRWFYTLAFLEKQQLDEVFVMDSDVMLFKNLSHYHPWKNRHNGQLAAYCIPDYQTAGTYSYLASAHCSFWTRTAIAEFCQYLLHTYSSSERQLRLDEKWQYHQKFDPVGGISDMALLYLYAVDHPGRVINLLQPVREAGLPFSSVFDNNINSPINLADQEFEEDKWGGKKIQWTPPYYVGTNRLLKEKCIFNSLHFQGLSKQRMHQYYQGTDLRLHRLGQEATFRFSPFLKPLHQLKNGIKRILVSKHEQP